MRKNFTEEERLSLRKRFSGEAMPLCGGPISREHSPRTSGSVKLYDGSSQPQVVDLGKSATRLGKVRRSVLNPINNVLNFRFMTEYAFRSSK